VVTTLWKVDDRASFALMREFYDRLAKATRARPSRPPSAPR
jgi:CHAT domain-containing protein